MPRRQRDPIQALEIKERRQRVALSQQELADLTKHDLRPISRSLIAKIETGAFADGYVVAKLRAILDEQERRWKESRCGNDS